MHSRISKRTVLAVTVLVATCASLVAASASPARPTGQASVVTAPPPSPLKYILGGLKGLSLQAREERLLNLARAEGNTLEWYTSMSSLIAPAIRKGFETKYGIKVNLYRASSEPILQRTYAEAKANVSGCDVVETNGTEMTFLQHKKDVIVPYRLSPYAQQIPKAFRFDTFTAARVEAFVVAWNTNLIKDPPTKFEDLAKPEFKGKIAIEATDDDWFAAMYQHFTNTKKMSTAATDNMMKAIFSNAKAVSGHTTGATLLAAGQFGVFVTAHAQSVEQLAAQKAPVTFGPPFVDPVIIRPQGVAICYRLRHKATALLFYDYLLSDEAAGILLKNGVEPARVGFEDQSLKGTKQVQMDIRPIVSNWKKWSDKFDALMLLTGK